MIINCRIEGSNQQVNLQKLERGDWQVQEPGETRWIKAENSTIVVLLDILSHLEAISFPYDAPSQEDLQRLGLENPSEWSPFRLAMNQAHHSTVWPTQSGEALHAKMEDVPYIYEVQKNLIDILEQHIYYKVADSFQTTLYRRGYPETTYYQPFPEGEPIIAFPEKKPLPEDEPTNSKKSDFYTRARSSS